MHQVRQYGFTLIELMVALAVAVVLAMLAVPNFRDLLDKSRLRGATDDVVNLLNVARSNAIKLGKNVNVSVNTTTWCAGAVDADPTDSHTIGNPLPLSAAPCDCAATTVACIVGGQNMLVASSAYSGATLSSVDNAIKYTSGAAGEGLTFDAKFGSIDLSSLPGTPLLKVTSPTGRYSTQISVSPLGQTYVCVPSGSPFVSGYPSC